MAIRSSEEPPAASVTATISSAMSSRSCGFSGHQVALAANGNDGVQAAREFHPDRYRDRSGDTRRMASEIFELLKA